MRVRVCMRKRPLLPAETLNDFDVLTCSGRTASLHQTRRKVDLEQVLENHTFAFDACFDEQTSTGEGERCQIESARHT